MWATQKEQLVAEVNLPKEVASGLSFGDSRALAGASLASSLFSVISAHSLDFMLTLCGFHDR